MFNAANTVEIGSHDTSVKKFIFTSDDAVAEAVLYGYPDYQERTVICCSTQAGCPVGCRFCGAGDNFVRSLTADEIVFQVVHLIESTGVDPYMMNKFQVMFMSMGEPMLNIRHLFPALRKLAEFYPNAQLLISTSGPDVDYDSLMDISFDLPTIGLQFSVHESTDAARDKLVPFKHKLSLQGMAAVGEKWAQVTGRKPFFNYCVHEGNNHYTDVERLAVLFDPDIWEATISVICERDEHVAAANERQRELALAFAELMMAAGYSTRMFDPAGQDDIGGGCGQLWFVQDWMAKHPDKVSCSVGLGLASVHTPR
jgi:23S rRNA (adenine2503-C2)-methyltransferase